MMLELSQKKTDLHCRVNKEAFFGNIIACTGKSKSVELSSAFLGDTWEIWQDDYLKTGINCVISDKGKALLHIDSLVNRILDSNSLLNELDCVSKGVIPVLHNLNECYALSNYAQMIGKTLDFALRVRNSPISPNIADENMEIIFSALDGIPMLNLSVLFFDFSPTIPDFQYIRQKCYNLAIDHEPEFYLPLSMMAQEQTNLKSFLTFETLGINVENGVFPLEISCSAYPVRDCGDKAIFRCYVGLANALPRFFPISLNGYEVANLKVEVDFFEFEAFGTPNGPFPLNAYITGGNEMYHADITKWDKKSLLAFIKANQFI